MSVSKWAFNASLFAKENGMTWTLGLYRGLGTKTRLVPLVGVIGSPNSGYLGLNRVSWRVSVPTLQGTKPCQLHLRLHSTGEELRIWDPKPTVEAFNFCTALAKVHVIVGLLFAGVSGDPQLGIVF